MSFSGAGWSGLLLVWLLSSVTPTYAGTVFYTVGADIGCDFSSIQAAIDSAATDGIGQANIRVARNQAYISIALVISAENLVLTGGYTDCADDTPSGRTVLDGSGGTADSVINISGSGPRVVLQNLSIRGGDPNAGNLGGGIQILGDNMVFLENVEVADNQSDRGAGIYIDGNFTARGGLVIDAQSSIENNTASLTGGGIHCVDVGGRELIRFQGTLINNQAIHRGGVYLDNCRLTHTTVEEGEGIIANQASDSGGGAYLTNAGSIRLTGAEDALTEFGSNTAGLTGGGLFVTGDGLADFRGVSFDGNGAGEEGGGVYLESGIVRISPAPDCKLARCARLEGNQSDYRGGAVFQTGGELSVTDTWIMRNSALDGSVIKTEGGTSRFENVIVSRNRNATAVMRLKNGIAEIYNSTFADNQDMGSTLLLTGGSVTLKGTIIWESVGNAVDFFGAQPTTVAECVLAHNFPLLITSLVIEDPLFVNAAQDNYHLQKNSPAVDYCFDVMPSNKASKGVASFDIEGDQRGFDVVSEPDEFGTFDLGADEWVETVFTDSFESFIW